MKAMKAMKAMKEPYSDKARGWVRGRGILASQPNTCPRPVTAEKPLKAMAVMKAMTFTVLDQEWGRVRGRCILASQSSTRPRPMTVQKPMKAMKAMKVFVFAGCVDQKWNLRVTCSTSLRLMWREVDQHESNRHEDDEVRSFGQGTGAGAGPRHSS